MIWVIGGTSDALKIADLLQAKSIKVLMSTTTSYGTDLSKKHSVKVIQKKLDLVDMKRILRNYSIKTVIDASHPFANIVSENAIAACKGVGVRYMRFEREQVNINEAEYYDSYAQIISVLKKAKGNILLTIGSKNIHLFKNIDSNRIIARVLPVKESIDLCKKAGLKAHQIIAMKGRVNKDTNKALMMEYNIKHLITKDSGKAGGLYEKVDAAIELGVRVHVLNRIDFSYPILFDNYKALICNI